MTRLRRASGAACALLAALGGLGASRAVAQPPSWDASLPDLALQDVRIEGRSLEEAWQQLGRRHLVRTILYVTDPAATRRDVRFSCARCRAREVLDALVRPFPGYGWAPDPATGVLWIRPGSAPTDALGQRVHLPVPQRGLPMQTGILAPLAREPRLGLSLHALRGVRATNTFDFAVDLPRGTFPLDALLSTLCRTNPTKTFYVRSTGAEATVTPVNLVGDEGDGAPEGLRHWWHVQVGRTGGSRVEMPDLRRALADPLPRVRWAARAYLEGMAWRTDLDGLVRGARSGREAVWAAGAVTSIVARHALATHGASLERLETEVRSGAFWRPETDTDTRLAALQDLALLTAGPEERAHLTRTVRYEVP